MATTEKTAVTVRSVIYDLDEYSMPVGDAEITEITAEGKISRRDGATRLSYTERSEGGNVECELLLRRELVRLKRRGAVELELDLVEGESVTTLYSIPPYKFEMTVKSRRVAYTDSALGLNIELEYDMCVGGAKRRASMTVFASVI